jgi:uncharacterized membrane protein YkoI
MTRILHGGAIMLKLISRWLSGKASNIQTRLSADQALAIARSATSGDALSRHLGHTVVEERSGSVVWMVSSATVGQMLEVSIDDTTGEVLDVRKFGVR